MSADLYLGIAAGVGIVTYFAGLAYCAGHADDFVDMLMMSLLALVGAVAVGFLWPATGLGLLFYVVAKRLERW